MMTHRSRKRILLITNIPTPYRLPLFNELNKQLKEHDLELKVVFGSEGYARRQWDIDLTECQFVYETLSSRIIKLRDAEKYIFTYKGLLKIIKEENPKNIIVTGFSYATTKIWLRSFWNKTPYLIWSGAIHTQSRADSFFRTFHRKMLVRRAAAFIAYGRLAKDFLIFLGAKPEQIHIGINTVDTGYFRESVQKIKLESKQGETKVLLFIGHLVKRKRVDLLFYAAQILHEKRKDFMMKVIGDGPERNRLGILAQDLGLQNVIRFEGFKQKNELPEYLAEAKCFLFPSEYEIWGLVLVEAMAAGLPCLASLQAGSTADLIEDGVTGFAVNFLSPPEIAKKIDWLLDHPELREKIGQNAKAFIAEKVSVERSAQGFVEAIVST